MPITLLHLRRFLLLGLFTCLLIGASGCPTKPRLQISKDSISSVENTCAFLKATAEERDWGIFYDALHPDVQDMVSRKKFIAGIKLHGKFARMIRNANFVKSHVRKTIAIAVVSYKNHNYDIPFRRDDFGWKVWIDGDKLDRLEKEIKKNLKK